jgi:hypothetical protein
MRERITTRLLTAADDKNKKPAKPVKREEGNIRNLDGFDYNKSKAKILKNALHNLNVALGTLISAMKDLAILRGSDLTPDGKLGGRGFIMEFREIKSIINKSIEDLSNVTDSIADELTNPQWGLKEKEVETVEKEQEVVEEKKEQVEDLTPGETPEGKPQPIQNEVMEQTLGNGNKLNDITPEDIRDASFLNSYRELLGPNAKDKVASVLSKRIVASISLKNKGA